MYVTVSQVWGHRLLPPRHITNNLNWEWSSCVSFPIHSTQQPKGIITHSRAVTLQKSSPAFPDHETMPAKHSFLWLFICIFSTKVEDYLFESWSYRDKEQRKKDVQSAGSLLSTATMGRAHSRVKSKSWARSSFPGLQGRCSTQEPDPSPTAFPGTSAGNRIGSGAVRIQTGTHVGCQGHGQWFNPVYYNVTPYIHVL